MKIKKTDVTRINKILNSSRNKKLKLADLDNLVANSNEHLTNAQITEIYKELGVMDRMKNSFSVKRAALLLQKEPRDARIAE